MLEIKQRPVHKGVILIAAHFDYLAPMLDVSALTTDRIAQVLASWPGPRTWVTPTNASTAGRVKGMHDGIAMDRRASDGERAAQRVRRRAGFDPRKSGQGQLPRKFCPSSILPCVPKWKAWSKATPADLFAPRQSAMRAAAPR